MSLKLTNCSKCGRIMAKGFRNICPVCYQEIEDQYEKCFKYLRENRKCSLQELSEATGVSMSMIVKFIREGRISIADYPNITYECDVCGAPIREGHLCEACRRRLIKDVNKMKDEEQRKAQQQEQKPGTIYLKDM